MSIITAKYPGRCVECGCSFSVGSKIRRGESGYTHAGCEPPDLTDAEVISTRMDDCAGGVPDCDQDCVTLWRLADGSTRETRQHCHQDTILAAHKVKIQDALPNAIHGDIPEEPEERDARLIEVETSILRVSRKYELIGDGFFDGDCEALCLLSGIRPSDEEATVSQVSQTSKDPDDFYRPGDLIVTVAHGPCYFYREKS